MQHSDVLATAALAISVFSLGATLYFQYLRPGAISAVVGDCIDLLYGPNREWLILVFPITFSNDGARPESIVRLEGHISCKKEHVPFQWDGFEQDKSDWLSSGVKRLVESTDPSPIAIHGYSSESRTVHFSTTRSCELTAGHYHVSLGILVGGKYRKQCSLSLPLALGQEKAEYLREKCVCKDYESRSEQSVRLVRRAREWE